MIRLVASVKAESKFLRIVRLAHDYLKVNY